LDVPVQQGACHLFFDAENAPGERPWGAFVGSGAAGPAYRL